MTLLLEVFFLVVIKLVLEFSYISFVYPVFGYAGFTYEFEIYSYVTGWLIYIMGYLLLFLKKPIYIFELYLIIFLVYVLPNIVYYSFSGQPFESLLILIVPYFLIVATTINIKPLNSLDISISRAWVIFGSIALIALVIVNSAIATGGQIVLNFSNEYEFREKFDDATTSGFFAYLNNWVAYIFVVIILSWAIENDKKLVLLLGFSTVFVLFAFSGHKGVLQSIILVLFFYKLFQMKRTTLLILAGFLSLLLVVVFVTNMFELHLIGSLIVRRLMFVPAHLSYTYIDYFSLNELVYWSNSILKGIFDYPYDVRPADVIAQHLGRKSGANTGFLSAGYMHAGYLGVLIYTVVAMLVLNFINYAGQNFNKFFVMALAFLPINILFRSSDLFTALLTHGVLITMLVLWSYSNRRADIKFGTKVLYRL